MNSSSKVIWAFCLALLLIGVPWSNGYSTPRRPLQAAPHSARPSVRLFSEPDNELVLPDQPQQQLQQQQQLPELPSQPSLVSDRIEEAVTSAIGGLLLGSLWGLYTDLATDVLSDTDLPPLLPPLVLGSLLSLISGLAASQSGWIGNAVSFVVGGPVRLGKKSIVAQIQQIQDDIRATPGKLQAAARDSLDRAVENVKAVPGRLSEAARQKLIDLARDIQDTPGRISRQVQKTFVNARQTVDQKIQKILSSPKRMWKELSEKSPSTVKIPTPPSPDTLPPEQAKSFLPPPEVKLTFPSLSLPKAPTKLSLIDNLQKTATVEPAEPTAPLILEKQTKTSSSTKAELAMLSLPSFSSVETIIQPSPSPNAKDQKDNFIFSEATLKEYIKDIQPKKTESDRQKQQQQDPPRAKDVSIQTMMQPAGRTTTQRKASTSRPTFSLFGLAGVKNTTTVLPKSAKTDNIAPKGVPVVSQWKFNRKDSTISGFIQGSGAFTDGEPIVTSAIVGDVSPNTVVRTKSGSRYFLGEEADKAGGVFRLFDRPKVPVSIENTRVDNKVNLMESRKNSVTAAMINRKQVEEKQKQQRVAEKLRVTREAEATIRRSTQKEQTLAARKDAEEVNRRSVEEAKIKREAEAAKREAQKRELAEKQRLAEEKLAKERQTKLKQKQAENAVRTASRGVTISLFGFGQKTDEGTVSSSTTTIPVPEGVPTISRWSQESDGSVSGIISGSSSFKNGERITTSPIIGNAIGGTIVKTKSGSRYFLSETGISAKVGSKGKATENKTKQLAKDVMTEKKKVAGRAVEKKALDVPENKILAQKKRQEQEKLARQKREAQTALSQAKRGSTISLFGLGVGQDNSVSRDSVGKSFIAPIPSPMAPKGIPTISAWKLNGDGSITGTINGSSNFKPGELVTTSVIKSGKIQSRSVVQTGSGSRYFLL